MSDNVSQAELMRELKDEVASRCAEVETISADYGLPLTKVTVIARDPSNDNMYLCVTNEDEAGLQKACGLALQPPATLTR